MSPSRLLESDICDVKENFSHPITKFANGRLVRDGRLVKGDIWINRSTGRIIDAQKSFYVDRALPDRVVDLKGKILAPGFVDVQFNGAFMFDLSKPPSDGDVVSFKKGLQAMNHSLIKTGVTSYLATMTSQSAHVYHKVGSHVHRDHAAEAMFRSFRVLAHLATRGSLILVLNHSVRTVKGHSSPLIGRAVTVLRLYLVPTDYAISLP